MKLKVLFLVSFAFLSLQSMYSQRSGVKIAYIDTEYILKNVPEYQQANTQLATKVQKWKIEVDGKLNDIKQRREALNNEKALLTKELFEERLEDLSFEEKEIIEYQQDRFGPQGDLVIQRKQLMQPVQDQIFQAVQDLAEARNYDFVFDKSADVVMLYSAEKYDISDAVLRTITRASKRQQATDRKERLEAEKEDIIEEEVSESQLERQRLLDEKKAKRDSIYSAKREALKLEREAQIEAKRKEREAQLKAREDARNNVGGSEDNESAEDNSTNTNNQAKETTKTREELLEERRLAREADRLKRQQELDEKRRLREEELKRAREERDKNNNPN